MKRFMTEDLANISYDYLGGTHRSYRIIKDTKWHTKQDYHQARAAIQAWMEQTYPYEHCTHEHDCCGHYYLRFRDVKHLEGPYYEMVLQYRQNV